jgi:hypothetical protein
MPSAGWCPREHHGQVAESEGCERQLAEDFRDHNA